MSITVEELLERAMELPTEDRLQLAEALLTSVEPTSSLPFDVEWITEAKRRAARVDSGEGKTDSWAEVKQRARTIDD